MKKQIFVKGIPIGGGAPVTVQSMTDTDTRDAEATLSQIRRLAKAGCDIVRVALPCRDAVAPLAKIVEESPLPVVADIHFDHRLAIEAVAVGVNKIRINPGNIGSADRVKAVADACRCASIPIRIGVNGGSLERELLANHGGATASALVASALAQIEMLHRFDFEDICVSLKASDVTTTIEANRLMRRQAPVPLHIGLTEAGTLYHGVVKSAVCIGALLHDGIGDTVRVSLTEDVAEEIKAAQAILQALGLRKGLEIISCPTCGRCQCDVQALAKEAQRRLAGCDLPLKVAIMGCAVNGPGEAREADCGIAGCADGGRVFRYGEIVGKVEQNRLLDALLEQIEGLEGRNGTA